MKVLSLFSGGGLGDYGLELAGMEIVGQVEIDDYCQKILKLRWPKVPKWPDIKKTHFYKGRLRPDSPITVLYEGKFGVIPQVDLIAGGFPCQDISTAGRGAGITGERSGLWKEMLRVICEVRPRFVLVENVTALLGRGLGVVLGDLAKVGYDCEWDCLPASALGAPHQRDRIWIVAHAKSDQGRISDGNGKINVSNSHSKHDERSGSYSGDVFRGQRKSSKLQGSKKNVFNASEPGLPNGSTKTIFQSQENQKFKRSNWWAVEPDLGRVVARYTVGSYTGGIDAHEVCIQKASEKGVPQTNRLRTLREYQKSSKASSRRVRKCSLCGHPMSALPCAGPCTPWYLGIRTSQTEDLRCLQEGIFSIMPQSDENLRTRVLGNIRTLECEQTMASRTDRLKVLGNAQVVQVVEYIGKLILQYNQQQGENRK